MKVREVPIVLEQIVVDAAAVERALSEPDWVVVDARSSSAFIGWRLDGEPREGHIKGALDFSADWLRFPDKGEPWKKEYALLDKMHWRGIDQGTNIIVYDYTGKDAPLVCEYLAAHGIGKLHYFPLSQWEGAMEFYPGYSTMVPVQWVKELIDGGRPEHFAGGDYRLFEISWGAASQTFLDTHIPGTVHMDSEEFEVGPEWVRVPDDKLEQFACKFGISVDTTVVVYGGIGAAAKLAVVLKYMGVKHVHLLNGTLDNWLAAGYPTESGDPAPTPCAVFGGKIPADPSALVDIEEAKRMLADPDLGQIIDIRSWKQFIGEESGYDYVPKAGRIPGTIWCTSRAFYCNPDGTMGNADEMVDHWKRNGVDVSKRMAFFCGSASWGGAVIEMYARAAGYSNATIYEGGWCQWQLDDSNPYEIGIPCERPQR